MTALQIARMYKQNLTQEEIDYIESFETKRQLVFEEAATMVNLMGMATDNLLKCLTGEIRKIDLVEKNDLIFKNYRDIAIKYQTLEKAKLEEPSA